MALPSWLSIAGVVVWVLYEVALRRKDEETASWEGGEEDRRSTSLLIASYLLAVLLVIILQNAGVGTVPVGVRWIGVAMVAAGLVLRAWGMAVLGRFYTRTLRVTGGQRIVQEGPYRLIRHPGYAGSLLVWTGYCLGVGNWIALVVVAALMLLAYSWRISSEERMLVANFGDGYRDYQRRTARLIPHVY
ncbi:isoprenylcysteine carboxylmethyltransferase family protein [Catenulispora subtropica]|uniref:Isoprenylcysteine carboxyl methyltransferase n=1 Tax=Catenulispora subtropica TaxID=450798 RepID=A0ABN2QUL0_9ACTN